MSIFTNAQPITKSYKELKEENDMLINHRKYHAQCTREFDTILSTLEMLPERVLIFPYILALFQQALFNQRMTEYALICHQFNVGVLGFKLESQKELYGLYYVLDTTREFLQDQVLPGSARPDRLDGKATKWDLAMCSLKNVEAIFLLLSDDGFQESSKDKVAIIKRLAICNQNLNKLIVIVYSSSIV